ncbi:ImmA/IrrE family metallo-endopeptidase [Calycomorphotria hydatis]|uniref:IrrE N-terminal-like domain-containing protein n=1 Tax=Calycomorphotria hydatis TaxID=2528027 RepID=A0A517TDM1_9PLAN|nr:ImmA/IrrE family metallo-endopeptidase [Calycomorphotria hydatis]QDT66480.1 hypothetical protein V22_37480 [Calycomorphotria hydatis]
MNEARLAATLGLRHAAETRSRANLDRDSAVNIFDLCRRLGVSVRFIDAPSLEGMYEKELGPTILLPGIGHRPLARLAYSCAHELGHHVLRHGTRIDELLGPSTYPDRKDPQEVSADTFAAFLLMPRNAIHRVLPKLSLSGESLLPIDCYLASAALGVGYSSLITHMSRDLRFFSSSFANTLIRTTPKMIRSQVWPPSVATNLIIGSERWSGIPMDFRVGDYLTGFSDIFDEYPSLKHVGTCDYGEVYEICEIGIETIDELNFTIRASHPEFIGLDKFRFLSIGDE